MLFYLPQAKEEVLWTQLSFSVLLLSGIQSVCLCSWCSFSLLQWNDGWQVPQAHIDFLLRYFTLSLSRFAMWHQSTLYSSMSVPSSLPYVGNACACLRFCVQPVFPAFHLHLCVCVCVSSPRLGAAPLVSCLTPGAIVEVKESLSALRLLIPTAGSYVHGSPQPPPRCCTADWCLKWVFQCCKIEKNGERDQWGGGCLRHLYGYISLLQSSRRRCLQPHWHFTDT